MSANSSPQISLLTATCIVIANMIGIGIFTSLGFQVGDLPSGFAIIALWSVGGVCAMCGALSYAELAAAYAERLPNAELIEVPRAGHWPWIDAPEVVDRVIDFL